MAPDKFKAVWLSHSSISDFIKCPRAYYLKYIYKDPMTGHKLTLMSPPLALGQAVHEVLESLSTLKIDERFAVSPLKKFDIAWKKVTGSLGGFDSREQEMEYKERGANMLEKVMQEPGPLLNKAVKITTENGLPYYWLCEEDNIILCGKIDWLEYLESSDSVHIIDFKTGKIEEEDGSLQLPIYLLLASNTQKRKVTKASYWYLNNQSGLQQKELPDQAIAYDDICKIGRRIKLARQLEHFVCPKGGCRNCLKLERIIKGEGKKVGVDEYRHDVFVLNT